MMPVIHPRAARPLSQEEFYALGVSGPSSFVSIMRPLMRRFVGRARQAIRDKLSQGRSEIAPSRASMPL